MPKTLIYKILPFLFVNVYKLIKNLCINLIWMCVQITLINFTMRT